MTREEAIYRLKALLTMCDFRDAFGDRVDDKLYEDAVAMAIEALSTDIVRCKDCAKKDKERGYYPNGEVVHKDEACPLIEFRGKAEGHEFDYQFCVYGERKEDG